MAECCSCIHGQPPAHNIPFSNQQRCLSIHCGGTRQNVRQNSLYKREAPHTPSEAKAEAYCPPQDETSPWTGTIICPSTKPSITTIQTRRLNISTQQNRSKEIHRGPPRITLPNSWGQRRISHTPAMYVPIHGHPSSPDIIKQHLLTDAT